MSDQYYTPAIEDLFIGYECELYCGKFLKPIDNDTKRINFTPDFDWDKDAELWQRHTVMLIPERARLRTPYLTREQIEAEGWRHVPMNVGRDDEGHRQRFDLDGRILLYYDFKRHLFSIMTANNLSCPSVNEFRKICDMIGIQPKAVTA